MSKRSVSSRYITLEPLNTDEQEFLDGLHPVIAPLLHPPEEAVLEALESSDDQPETLAAQD